MITIRCLHAVCVAGIRCGMTNSLEELLRWILTRTIRALQVETRSRKVLKLKPPSLLLRFCRPKLRRSWHLSFRSTISIALQTARSSQPFSSCTVVTSPSTRSLLPSTLPHQVTLPEWEAPRSLSTLPTTPLLWSTGATMPTSSSAMPFCVGSSPRRPPSRRLRLTLHLMTSKTSCASLRSSCSPLPINRYLRTPVPWATSCKRRTPRLRKSPSTVVTLPVLRRALTCLIRS